MLPNTNRSSSSVPVATPPPGHQRNRIACVNCRKRKIKCITDKKQPRSACERCTREGAICEYIAAPSEDEISPSQSSFALGSGSVPPVPRWVEPLDPESYARNKGAFPSPPAPQGQGPSSMYSGYGGQAAAPPGNYPMTPFQQQQHGHPYSSQLNPTMLSNPAHNIPGNRYPAGGNSPYPGINDAANINVHYGPFPGPAGTVYPWSQPRPQAAANSYNGGCTCTTAQCFCGRRNVQY
ncbi:hypothetical protein B0H11DRAFT_1946606 [Mycena galericulata]|nr:hypothetical protein B0H11DRAFT_1946606 [Mycena galericulata]